MAPPLFSIAPVMSNPEEMSTLASFAALILCAPSAEACTSKRSPIILTEESAIASMPVFVVSSFSVAPGDVVTVTGCSLDAEIPVGAVTVADLPNT